MQLYLVDSWNRVAGGIAQQYLQIVNIEVGYTNVSDLIARQHLRGHPAEGFSNLARNSRNENSLVPGSAEMPVRKSPFWVFWIKGHRPVH
jgi:hypothetical protein